MVGLPIFRPPSSDGSVLTQDTREINADLLLDSRRRSDGRPAGIGRRLLRAVLKNAVLFIALPFGMIENIAGSVVCLALGLAGLIGFFWMFTADRRALHDKISGTAVVPRSAPV